MILEITKTFGAPIEVAESIRTEVRMSQIKFKLKKSKSKEQAIKAAENALNFEIQKNKYSHYHTQNQKFEENWERVFTLLWENYCFTELQNTVKEMSVYESRIENQPLELLTEIKFLMHTPEKLSIHL